MRFNKLPVKFPQDYCDWMKQNQYNYRKLILEHIRSYTINNKKLHNIIVNNYGCDNSIILIE